MTTEYRGLDLHAPVFLTGGGKSYQLIGHITATGNLSYSCDALGELFRKLYLPAGIELLGHEKLTATKRLVDAVPARLGSTVALVI